MKAQLQWVGHVVRMDDTRLPKIVFFSELARTGARNIGRPLKRFKDGLKASLDCAAFPLLDGKPSPQTTAPGEWPSTRAFKALKKSGCTTSTRSDSPARRGDLAQVLLYMPSVWSHLCVQLRAAFSSTASLTSSSFAMDFHYSLTTTDYNIH